MTLMLLLLMLAHCIGPGSHGYLISLKDQQQKPPALIFQSALLGDEEWIYNWSVDKSPSTTKRFFHLNPHDGSVRLRRTLPDCSVWKLGIEARRHLRENGVYQVLIPLIILNDRCDHHQKVLKDTTINLLASVPQPGEFNEICFRRSELILSSLTDYLPESIRRPCRADHWSVLQNSDQLAVEPSGVDLVSTTAHCHPGNLAKTRVTFRTNCSAIISEWMMDISIKSLSSSSIRHRRRRASTDSAAPFSFEQPLYLTSVPEERDRGTFVLLTTHKT